MISGILKGRIVKLKSGSSNVTTFFKEQKMKINDSIQFGNIIRNRRKALGYTQAFLSEYSGLSVSFISDLENGKPTAELEKVLFLSSILGLDVNVQPRG